MSTSGDAYELPEDVADLLRQDYNGQRDFNRRVFLAGYRCRGLDISEDDAVDLVVDHVLDYPRKDLSYQVRRTLAAAYEKYDPEKAAGGLVARLQAFKERVERCNDLVPVDKACVLALAQRAINVGIHPVAASSHELAALSGYSAWSMAEAMKRLSASRGNGLLFNVTWDGIKGHTRVWTLDLDWGRNDQTPHTYVLAASAQVCDKRSIQTLTAVATVPLSADEIREVSRVSRKDTRAAVSGLVDEGRLVLVKGNGNARRYAHNLLADYSLAFLEAAPQPKPEKLKPDVSRFHEYMERQPMGTSFTAKSVSEELGVSHGVAMGWLIEFQAEYCGDARYNGDRRRRKPMTWWREPKR